RGAWSAFLHEFPHVIFVAQFAMPAGEGLKVAGEIGETLKKMTQVPTPPRPLPRSLCERELSAARCSPGMPAPRPRAIVAGGAHAAELRNANPCKPRLRETEFSAASSVALTISNS